MDNQLAGENRILWPRVIGAVLLAALIVVAIWFVASRLSGKKEPAKPTGVSSGPSEQRQQPRSPGSTATPAPPSSSPTTPPGNTDTSQKPSAPAQQNTTTSRQDLQPSQSAAQGPQSQQLANTGPGEVLKLFAGTSLAAGVGHYALRRRQLSRGRV